MYQRPAKSLSNENACSENETSNPMCHDKVYVYILWDAISCRHGPLYCKLAPAAPYNVVNGDDENVVFLPC